ncbi:GNAT family N-acetyltransferase [Bacillus testis]|uniref:GNAT family N-acetyltransferase n=1 Tax=Bacillus testis TaxID=1622072 RepID=UPI00067F4908|nr:GNAT family N-acetyltransferase [Bacillus testis]
MLTEHQLNEIQQLQQECEQYDGIQLKLNIPTLSSRKEECEILHYGREKLAAFIAFYKFGNEVEVCGMVHPDYRRKGVFSLLFDRLMAMIPDGEQILLNAPAGSLSAKKWLEKHRASYEFSEIQMKWNPLFPLEQDGGATPVTLRKAMPKDVPFQMELDALCFGIKDAQASDYDGPFKEGSGKDAYMIGHNGAAVGKIQVSRNKDETWINGFAIHPDEQGKGIGASALRQTVSLEAQRQEDLRLEVAVKNERALQLYKRSGFEAYHTQDYYAYAR